MIMYCTFVYLKQFRDSMLYPYFAAFQNDLIREHNIIVKHTCKIHKLYIKFDII